MEETEDANLGFCPFCGPCGGLNEDKGRLCVGVCDKEFSEHCVCVKICRYLVTFTAVLWFHEGHRAK